jgi:hypothetical protein
MNVQAVVVATCRFVAEIQRLRGSEPHLLKHFLSLCGILLWLLSLEYYSTTTAKKHPVNPFIRQVMSLQRRHFYRTRNMPAVRKQCACVRAHSAGPQ